MRHFILALLIFHSIAVCSQETSFAPDFSMKLMDSSVVQLEDFKGEVVYISFWASWCGPCLTNFEKYKDIRNELEKEGIILLNVSIDEDPNKWKAAVENFQINGTHTLASKEDLYPAYQISSIPLYEIVGNNGQFLYLSDEYGRDIIGQFKTWMEE